MELVEAAKRAVLVLNRADITFALCGGLATAVHGHVRATRDIDVLVRDDAGREAAAAALAADGWVINPSPISFPDGFTLQRAVLADAHGATVMLDVLVQPAGTSDLLADRERADIDNCACYVVSKRSLIIMKRSAGRPKDLQDIEALLHPEGTP